MTVPRRRALLRSNAARRPAAGPAVRTAVAPRFFPPNGDDSNGMFGAETWTQSKTAYTARTDMNGFQVDSWGFNLQNNAGTEGYTVQRTVRGKLEYPSGTFTDFTWASSPTKLIAGISPGDVVTGNKSDTLTLGSVIPSGATYWVHWEEVGSAYTLLASGYAKAGEAYGSGTTGMPTLGTSYAGSTASTRICMPNLVTALHTSARPLVAFLGDSNTVDQQHVFDATQVAGFPRAISGTAHALKFCMSGNAAADQASNALASRKQILQAYNVAHCFVLLGTNDLPGSGNTATTLEGYLDTLASVIKGVGVLPHFMTLPPKTGGAEATRGPLNAYIRSTSGTGNYGAFFELADVVETARDSGTWKTGYTGDNLHVNWAATTPATAVINALNTFCTAQGIA